MVMLIERTYNIEVACCMFHMVGIAFQFWGEAIYIPCWVVIWCLLGYMLLECASSQSLLESCLYNLWFNFDTISLQTWIQEQLHCTLPGYLAELQLMVNWILTKIVSSVGMMLHLMKSHFYVMLVWFPCLFITLN